MYPLTKWRFQDEILRKKEQKTATILCALVGTAYWQERGPAVLHVGSFPQNAFTDGIT